MKRKIIALLMAVTMGMCMLSGCGAAKDTEGNVQQDASGEEKTEAQTDAQDSGGQMEEAHLNILMAGQEQPEHDRVVEEINRLLKEELNTTIDITFVSFGNYKEQCQLALSGGDEYDIIMVMGSAASGYINAGYLTDLSDLIDAYGSSITEQMPDTAKALCMNNMIYAIPMNREYVQQYGVFMRKDIVDKYGIDVNSIKSLEDMTDVYAAVQAGEPDMTMYMLQKSSNGYPNKFVADFDSLGDYCGVLMDPVNSSTVENLFETEAFMNYCNLMREWNLAGYTLKDAATNTESPQSMVKTGI